MRQRFANLDVIPVEVVQLPRQPRLRLRAPGDVFAHVALRGVKAVFKVTGRQGRDEQTNATWCLFSSFARTSSDSSLERRRKTVCTRVRAGNTCILVAYHDDKIQPGQCRATVGKLADFLKENGI